MYVPAYYSAPRGILDELDVLQLLVTDLNVAGVSTSFCCCQVPIWTGFFLACPDGLDFSCLSQLTSHL